MSADSADQAAPSALFGYSHLVLTLGGDGTVLKAASMFGEGECPPVLCFSLGSLGFLLPFRIDSFRTTVADTLGGTVSILYRMRLECRFLDKDGNRLPDSPESWQVMNEIVLHRGKYSHLAVLDAFLDDQHLTEAIVSIHPFLSPLALGGRCCSMLCTQLTTV